MTPEGKLKKEVKEYLDSLGSQCWYYMPVPTGYGKRGIPDFVGCYKSYFFGIETKTEGREPTPWQTKTGCEISYAQGFYVLAYNLNAVKTTMQKIDAL